MKLISQKKVLEMIGISRRTLYRLRRNNEFPSPIAIPGVERLLWMETEINDWIESAKRRSA